MAKRLKTDYPGVVFILSTSKTGKPEKVFYIYYRKDGKQVEEKVGRSIRDNMTPAKASRIRAERIEGRQMTNNERRIAEQIAKDAEGGRWTVDRIFSAYKESHPTQASLKSWVSIFNTHILSASISGKTPDELVSLDIERLRRDVSNKKNKRTGKPLSDQTVKHVLSLLKRILRWAADMGHIAPPAHLKFNFPSVDNQVTEKMTAEQARAYFLALDAEANQDAAAYFRFMLLTGIRKKALLALCWEDVDFDRSFLVLQGRTAKGRKTNSIPISPGALTVLKGINRTESPFVWPGKNGGQRVDFQRMGRRLRKKAGLPSNFRPCHGLRHCFASWLASSGQVTLLSLQKLLTHESIAMTQRYAHLTDGALKQAAAVADSMWEFGLGDQNILQITNPGAAGQ